MGYGLGTFAALLLIFAALDDIATDNATTFRAEYTALFLCAIWLGFLVLRLLRAGYTRLGAVSLVALAAGVWSQHGITPGMTPGFRAEYLGLPAAYLWFIALASWLLWRGVSGPARV
jgi:hypothetical protein